MKPQEYTGTATEFEIWWGSYPRKVGKLAAALEYQRARKKATAEELLDGIDRYRLSKPSYADWCHPRTFLKQGRWMDGEDTDAWYQPWVCPHVVPCSNRAACESATFLGRPVKGQAEA